MNCRAYVILNIVEGRKQQAARRLFGKPGLKAVDILDGKPDIIFTAQAASRRKLADIINQSIALIEPVLEDIMILPVQTNKDCRIRLKNLSDSVTTEQEETMDQFAELYQTADWKTEKHVPVIECADKVKAGDLFQIKVSIGKEIAHPNTTEHHIRWISVYFRPAGEKFAYQVAHFEFTAHGESTEGANQGPVYTHHEVITSMKLQKAGTIYATSLCNIHGLWHSAKEVSVS